mgnify:CR=1 FL=1
MFHLEGKIVVSKVGKLNVRHEAVKGIRLPGDRNVKVLQIGEGKFLRGFFDWMIHKCYERGVFDGGIVVTQPRPSGKIKLEELRRQDGLYTLVTRGLLNGQLVDSEEIISVFSEVVDPYSEWSKFLSLAEHPSLEFVVSNTTEDGLAYQNIPFEEGIPILSFPGRLTMFLYRRFQHFQGDGRKGLIIIPCELVERNGEVLKQHVLRHSEDWGLPSTFIDWLYHHNLFLNSLVDRIVTAPSPNQAKEWFVQWGYQDSFLLVTEPYYFWAIEGSSELDQRLPLRKAGLNVQWVDDLTPYYVRKVRILNGLHTLMAPMALLHGFKEVREVVEHPIFGLFIQEAMEEEIIPSLPYDTQEIMEYAQTIIERFKNPFISHRLIDISINSISKFKIRLLPSLRSYTEQKGYLPTRIVKALAYLIRFYKVKKSGGLFVGFKLDGTSYEPKDNQEVLQFFSEKWGDYELGKITIKGLTREILSNHALWGENLDNFSGLTDMVCREIQRIGERQ